ncbi:MAG TPA: alkylhydroperoxidase-related (seleno)protein, partial [Hyphomicrobiaceae bacterium]|nr:alkylhydroperoxidase-related (seleno)protein [Hyphomicrobiaceae bacterium]
QGEARAAVRRRLGDAALVDAVATFASFNAIVKIADGTGIPIEAWKEERTRDFRATLGIETWDND